MANRLLVLALFVSCSPIPVTPNCTADAECGVGAFCDKGDCRSGIAGVDPADRCTAGETRPCGPAAVGACRRGLQHCVSGIFEMACPGEVTPTAETCNSIDDDCDGAVDDGALITFYVDRDGDGFGSNASGAEKQQSCTLVAGFVANDDDCNDTRAMVNPNATEICDPADVDEDCDGMANENCGCSNIGMSQACCTGRGTQTCEARDGGATLSLCSVAASPEFCNGIDDDCDGVTDELYATTAPDGGVLVLSDGGVIELDGGCSVGVGVCSRTAATACNAGSLSCAAVAGVPGAEVCNNVDDDCDGQTDEASTGLCPASGQVCTAGACQCPAGQTACGTSCQPIGDVCTQGTGACARTGTLLCTSGSATCSAVAGSPGAEICNNIDDNCDGQTDEAAAPLCPAVGQTCSIGTCSCPAGQVVCAGSCDTLGGSCSAGVGACFRTGAIACTRGGPECNAIAGPPAAEACDGIDNNCDGTIDEGVQVACYPDQDNDRYSSSTALSAQCPDFSRAMFGNCPSGFVAPSAALGGGDCSPNDASLFRLMPTRGDGDGDRYCVGTQIQQCTGLSAPAGRRFATECLADDCDDTSAARFVNISVRADADNDGYCFNPAVLQCGNGSPAAGTRESTRCLGNDCRDSNPQATITCFLTGAYQSASATKQCGAFIPSMENKTVAAGSCPAGWSRVFAAIAGAYSGDSGGNCTATSDTSLTMSCGSLVFGAFSCAAIGSCTAN